MRKLIILLLLIPSMIFAQSRKEKRAAEHALISRQIDSIQLISDKAVIDVIVDMPGISQKEIFTRLRNWASSAFNDSKNVLNEDDIDNGILSGKGAYHTYDTQTVLGEPGWIHFFLNIKVKDGKFRYQLSDLYFEYEKKTAKNGGIGNRSDINYNFLLKRYKEKGQFFGELRNLVLFKDYIDKSIREAVVAPANDISDF